jgi:hypothetical protein
VKVGISPPPWFLLRIFYIISHEIILEPIMILCVSMDSGVSKKTVIVFSKISNWPGIKLEVILSVKEEPAIRFITW